MCTVKRQRILGGYFEDFSLTDDQAEHVMKFRENLQWRRRLNHLFRIYLQAAHQRKLSMLSEQT